jgi:hypothetical protein
MATLLLMLVLGAPSHEEVDTIVVCPQEFRQALVPWLAYRRGQGHRIAVISNLPSAAHIRTEIRRIAAAAPVRHLVLVGDADPAMEHDPSVRQRCVPAHHAAAVVNLKFGAPEPDIATDNWYADLDDDRVPDLATGRLTADSPAELERMVQKILAYERSNDFGRWRRQLHFVAGTGGFGPVADTVLEAAAKTLIADGVPAPYDTTMTYASWQSPYCPDPRSFNRVALERLNEGSLFWVYIGHGYPQGLDPVRVPGGMYPILSSCDAALLSCRHGAPIACFLACYTGAFDQRRDCLAEEMLRAQGGPVAVLASSRVAMPYAMSVLGSELLTQLFAERRETVGETFLAAKRGMAAAPRNEGLRGMIEAVGKTFQGSSDDLAAERIEHLDLFNLLGDPLVRLPCPSVATVESDSQVAAGQDLEVAGTSPLEGTCTVELVVSRGRLTFQPPRRDRFDALARTDYDDVYRRANEPRLASAEVPTRDGRFVARLAVPSAARGACQVRVFVEGANGCAAGAARVRVDQPANGKPAD